jgi:hypothetical protein
MTLKDFLLSMLSDVDGQGISTKRVVGSAAFIVYLILIFVNTYTDYKTPNVFVDGDMYIILAAFFGSALEYFSKRQTSVSFSDGRVLPPGPAPAPPAPPHVQIPQVNAPQIKPFELHSVQPVLQDE